MRALSAAMFLFIVVGGIAQADVDRSGPIRYVYSEWPQELSDCSDEDPPCYTVPFTHRALCPRSTRVIGGGAGPSEPPYGEEDISLSYPVDDADEDSTPDDGWQAEGGGIGLKVWAICR